MLSPAKVESFGQSLRSATKRLSAVAVLGLSSYLLHFNAYPVALAAGGNPEAIGKTIRSLPLNPQQLAYAFLNFGFSPEIAWFLTIASTTILPIAAICLSVGHLARPPKNNS